LPNGTAREIPNQEGEDFKKNGGKKATDRGFFGKPKRGIFCIPEKVGIPAYKRKRRMTGMQKLRYNS